MRAFLSLLETRGAGDVPTADLRDALAGDGEAVRAALVAEGVLRPGPLATTHPCEGVGCAREVRERTPAASGARRFLAVCAESPRACETLNLVEADVAQETIALDAFLAVVRRALRIDAPLRPSKPAGRGARLAGADAPTHLGEQLHLGKTRDVFFTRRPSAPPFATLLAERRATTRPTLVLVPTARGIEPELLARHDGGHVAVAALSDLLVVHDGRVTAARALREVPRIETSPASRSANVATRGTIGDLLPRAARWGDVTFYSVERDGLIGVEIAGRQRLFTAADLGMADGRTRDPVRAFVLLRRICDGNGIFDTRPWGGRENGKKIVSELRQALSAAFEMSEIPIEAYSKRNKSWKTKFRALAGKPSEVARLLDEIARGRDADSKPKRKR
jgi:hypothetical protein